MKTAAAIRYLVPLREGGSLPAVMEADDGRRYVVKFKGAGQGVKALLAELVCGELARGLGLAMPELALLQLDPVLGRNEPDPEIRDLLKASGGTNLGMIHLEGAVGFDPVAPPGVSAREASQIVWFDALVRNVDRTAKNPNLLLWNGRLWLIDHGAALYFHHGWSGPAMRPDAPFAQVKQHVLLPRATELPAADAELRPRVTPELVFGVLAEVPDQWLAPEPHAPTPEALRQAYARWLIDRVAASSQFTAEAARVRAELV